MTWPAVVPLLADTSAWGRSAQAGPAWPQAADDHRIVTCEIVRMELLFSARDRREVEVLDAELGALPDRQISRGTLVAGRGALLALAARGSPGHHRVSPPDAIIAACDAEHGCAVLHYDARFDRLAEVLDFPSVWIMPRGTADR